MSLLRRNRADEEQFVAFVEAHQVSLRKLAYTLCGNTHHADDLVQTALTKLYVAWPRVVGDGRERAYARQILVRSAIDESRRAHHRERPGLDGVEVPATDTEDNDGGLVAALQRLPRQQRACVVLRHWMDLSVGRTAETLGISEGTVKSHTARGLEALRATIGATDGPSATGAAARTHR